jgi:glycosyltransferase involved in cell wall biosynthesis
MLFFERETLQAADWVLPVYEPILEYARRRGATRIQVCYNVINPTFLRKKSSYELHHPPRVISVGRQIEGKNPENLIRAVARTEAELTIVGDGELHDHLRSVAGSCGMTDRAAFHRAIPNDRLCEMLPDFDIFATHTDYFEVPKAVLEPLLTGLPTILNRRIGKPVPELQGDWVMLVENSEEGYHRALQHLLNDHGAREALGRRAGAHAQERFAPERAEARIAQIYQQAMAG